MMIRRFAAAIWWLGTLFGILMLIFTGMAAVAEPELQKLGAVTYAIIGVLGTGCAWTLAFVLSGSFLRPPR